jgi:hypothetical protein
MPYFPKEREGITLTLKTGDTVTLVERNISQGERKALRKRLVTTTYDFKFKEKQGKEIDKKIEEAGLDKSAFEEAAEEAASLFDNTADTLMTFYAVVLAARFKGWDVYATREDLEAQRPVALERDAIIEFVEADPRNFLMIEDLMEQLRKHEGLEEKKEQSAQDVGGSSFTPKAASSEKHQNA